MKSSELQNFSLAKLLSLAVGDYDAHKFPRTASSHIGSENINGIVDQTGVIAQP